MAARTGPAMEETAANPIREDTVIAGIHKYSSSDEKIHLFRSLFCGREDVFARRWYSTKTEKADIHRSVPMSGGMVFVSNQKAAVQSVKTGSLCH